MALRKVAKPRKAHEVKTLNSAVYEEKESYLDMELFPYSIKGKDLCRWEGNLDQYVPISKAVAINEIRRNIETKEIEVELIFWAYDRWEKVIVNRADLAKREIKKLASKGLDVLQEDQAAAVSAFLTKQDKYLKPVNVHKEIGWSYLDNNLVFKHQDIVSKSSLEIQSTYIGEFDIAPKGSLDGYLRILRDHVQNNPALQIMLCVSISSLIIGMLNRAKLSSLDSLLVHIYGDSSTGKTTAAKLGVSIAGSPNPSGGLLLTYNGTRNSMAHRLGGNYGIPIVFDESSMNQMDQDNFSSFIYEMAQNVEKSRMTKDLEVRESRSWSTAVISTGESSILARSNNNEGLRMRLFEFSRESWTKDAKSADSLGKGLLNNYGHLAPEIAKKMLELGPRKIYEMVEDNKNDWVATLPESRFRDRISHKFALMYTAAELFEDTFDMEFQADELLRILLEQEKTSMSEREMAPKFHVELKQQLIRYSRNFKRENQSSIPPEIWGKIEVDAGETRCYILPVIFERFVKELGYTDTKVLVDQLKKEGYIVHDPSKNQKKKIIFSKEESGQRETLLGKEGYAARGDYTYCIRYAGNIFEDDF